MIAALGLVAFGLGLLVLGSPAIAVALVLYGAGNGIYSIARESLPLALFGAASYAVLMGRLAMPSLSPRLLHQSSARDHRARRGGLGPLRRRRGLACLNVALVAALWGVMPSGPQRD
jgi:hypothetical protein